MLPKESEQLQPYKGYPYINKLPAEIMELIISEYAIGSITSQRNIPMNFLLVCRKWNVIAQSCRHLFTPGHLVVNGHDEVTKLALVSKTESVHAIHPSIRILTVNFSPKYTEEPLGGIMASVPTMVQIQQTLDHLRGLFVGDWIPKNDGVPAHWETLNLERFTLVVDLSAISAREGLFRGLTRNRFSRLSYQLRKMGWKGSEGIHHRRHYTYWDR